MRCEFHKQFLKDIQKLDSEAKNRLLDFLDTVEQAKSFGVLSAKKIKGYKDFWRFRVGNYRVGVSFDSEVIVFRRVLHRKNIYKKFP